MRWLALLLVFYLFPILPQPGGEGPIWSLAHADDDDDGDDGDDDDDDDNDDDDDDDDGGPSGRGDRDDGDGLFGLFGDDDDRAFIEDEIVGIGLDRLDIAALELVGFRVAEQADLGALGLSMARLAVPQGLRASEALALARSTRPAASFDFNHLYRNSGSSCRSEHCWPRQLIGLQPSALDSCTAGRSIAMIDTAVDSAHAAFADSRITQQAFRPPGSAAAPPDHGTAVAALLVGKAAGDFHSLMPQARLLAADVFYLRDGEVESDALAILRALDWAVAQEAEVIAFSLSGQANDALARGVTQAARRAALVAAAGNDGPTGLAAFPAAYPEVLAVTAVDARKRAYRHANRGSYIDLAAPGVGVLSADPKGGFETWSGTSFAVPFAAAALLHAGALAGGDPARAKALLAESAEDLGALGRDEMFGWGLLRVPQGACD